MSVFGIRILCFVHTESRMRATSFRARAVRPWKALARERVDLRIDKTRLL